MTPLSLLSAHARALGWPLTEGQLATFQIYADDLELWNARSNLTAITGLEAVQVKHFLDSLTCLQAMPAQTGLAVIDVGSGAGFPGLPLKIVRPDMRLTLLESVGKKADFLRHLTARLGLADVAVILGRAEDHAQNAAYRETYDVVVARAVAELRVLAELTLPLCRVGGLVIAQKRAAIDDEIASAAQAIAILGGALRTTIPIALPGVDPRQLIVLDKLSPTPARYPRRAGMPEKRPL